MLDEYHPDFVVAFPGGRGTAHMVRISRQAGVEVADATEIKMTRANEIMRYRV